MNYTDLTFDSRDIFLVTGGAGFIGSNLCEAILKLGCNVRCLDDLSNGKMENIEMFLENPKFAFLKGDIINIDICMQACAGVDYVLHQAAWGSVPRSIEMPLYYEKVNICGTINMMEAARQSGVKKFVYASSSSVYGDSTILPKIEGSEGKLLSPYALTKHANEEYGKLYYTLYGLETYGMRYFNVFGKKQDPNGAYAAVIPKFIKLMMENKQPVIYGDGKQSRDFTYIDNVIEANLKACKASRDAAGEVYNIAFGERQYLLDVFNIIANSLGKKSIPLFRPERQGDIKHSNADITKARERLDYDPLWNFEKGINAAIRWYTHYFQTRSDLKGGE